jgi:hypothetical protein
MSTTKKKTSLLNAEEAEQIRQALQEMVPDAVYNTGSSYSADAALYPDNLISFVDKHMNYLMTHPGIDPWRYVANIRLMTRIR